MQNFDPDVEDGQSKLSDLMTSSEMKIAPTNESDITSYYVAGFVIGWFTWFFGSVLGLFAGKGTQAIALRKGLFVGAVSVTLPFAAIVALFAYFVTRWNTFIDKFNLFG